MLAAPPFNYLEMLDKVDAAIDANAELARNIVRFGLRSFDYENADETEGSYQVMPEPWVGVAKYGDIDKARGTLRQFYRDWSAEGAVEREASYGPVSPLARAHSPSRILITLPGSAKY